MTPEDNSFSPLVECQNCKYAHPEQTTPSHVFCVKTQIRRSAAQKRLCSVFRPRVKITRSTIAPSTLPGGQRLDGLC